MKNILSFTQLINENLNIENLQNLYLPWEMGLIKAWGGLLYLSFHDLDENIQKKVSEITTKKELENYFLHSDDDEDLVDWFSDIPPTMNGGYALYDKKWLKSALLNISEKTKLVEPLIVYRFSKTEKDGWNSYTTDENIDYSYFTRSKFSYRLPIGYPVIFADGIADNNEVIINMSLENQRKFII